MALTKLQFNPGINREVTAYTNGNGWFDGDKIRFRFGNVEKIGGWTKRQSDFSFLGICRKLFPWTDLANDRLIAIGTSSKLYIKYDNKLYDITPVRASSTINENPFDITNGSSLITVTDTDHAAFTGDFVTFSGATTLGGNITANVLNQEYVITKIDANSYTINARAAGTSILSITEKGVQNPTPVLASGSDSDGGGSSVVAAYKNSSGLNSSVAGSGWSAGTWSRSTWDSTADITGQQANLRVWSMSNFGEDLIIGARNGPIFYWDTSANKASMSAAVNITALGSADGYAPAVATGVIVSEKDKHIIAYGAGLESDTDLQDPLLIRFSHQKDPLQWQSTPTNTAGALQVSHGSFIVTAVQTKQEILIITDKSIHSMQFIGPPLTFGINLISQNISICGATAVEAIDDTVYWMGAEEFYVYNGAVNKIPCTVRDYVFRDFNVDLRDIVASASNATYSEVWWFYPSNNATQNDRYVMYNYAEQVWAYGNLGRDAWVDRGLFFNPIAAFEGHLYDHENGTDDGTTSPPAAISAHIESGDMEIPEGDRFYFMNRIIPDVSFRGSTNNSASVDFTIKSKNSPGNSYNDSGSETTASTVTKDSSVQFQYGVDAYNDTVDVRVRGRSFAFRLESSDTGIEWRLGTPRVDIKPDGRR